jgi:hypothetical protein
MPVTVLFEEASLICNTNTCQCALLTFRPPEPELPCTTDEYLHGLAPSLTDDDGERNRD